MKALSHGSSQEQEHFGGLSSGGLALGTQYIVKDVDFSSLEVQRSLEEVGQGMMELKSISVERGLKSWHTAFSLWANFYRGPWVKKP